jgi:hypothetical protein
VFAGLQVILYDSDWMGVCELGREVRDSQVLGDESKYLQATAGIYSYLKATANSSRRRRSYTVILRRQEI